jgi:mannitol/fructose-specific phosphotransferase system IIA component (Ntr-type)
MNGDKFREKLLNAKDKNEILQIFKEEEKQYPDV